jgi:hypothetical protein
MNGGVMTHEFAHAVFDALVKDPNRGAGGRLASLSASATNFLYGLNEGVADYFAAARTGDPDYMSHTIQPELFVADCNGVWKEIVRDTDVAWAYTSGTDTAAREWDPFEFCPYDVGAFWASLMYGIAKEIDPELAADDAIPSAAPRQQVAGWLLGALDQLGRDLPVDFELWDAINLFVAQIESEAERSAACVLVELRYGMYFNDMVVGC